MNGFEIEINPLFYLALTSTIYHAKKVLAIERLRFPSKCSVNKNPHPSLIERWGFTIIQ